MANRATIMSLPPELLIMIFDYVDAPLREARERNGASQTCVKAVEDFNERFTRGDDFPYLYADVCEHWAAVILGVPRFWTNAVVFIGPREKAHGNYIGNGQTIFDASGTLPFDVTIRSTMVDLKSNHNTWSRPVDRSWRGEDLERERMEIVNVLKFLAPHIHRCRSLSLYTLLLGAMPLLYRHLHGPAPLLKMLTLQTDPMYYLDRWPPFSGDSKLLLDFSPVLSSFAPPLEKLIVDGISFRDIRQHHAGIWETYGVNIVSLFLVNRLPRYQTGVCSPFNVDTMLQALAPLVNLDSLTLSHIYFNDYFGDSEGPLTVELGVRALTLENMNGSDLVRFFAAATFPELEELRFKDCWPEFEGQSVDPFDLPSNVPVLTLEDFMVASVNLAHELRFWDVHTIRICNSPYFDDNTLDMFAAPREEVDQAHITPATEFGCDALRVLSIIAAPEISVEALKRMVTSRNRWVNYADPTWRTNVPIGPAILEISLWQLPGQMVFTEEDEAWFRAHVAHFQFNWVADEYRKNRLSLSEHWDLDRVNF